MAVKKTQNKRTKKRKKKAKKNSKSVLPFIIIAFLITAIFLLFAYGYKISLPKAPTNLINTNQALEDSTAIEIIDLSKAIDDAINLLGVEPKNLRSYEKDGVKRYKISIDKSRMDLNFANLILTGKIETAKGKIISAEEIYNGQRQIMDIEDSQGNKYLITLVYTKSSNLTQKKKELAIIVDDFGYFNSDHLQEFLDLDKNVTFSILPFEQYSKHVMGKAVEYGHETMIHMPMEPIDYPHHNPGPDAIYIHMKEREIRNQMQKYFKALPLCVGANNHMGSLVTSDPDVMRIVLEEIQKKNLYFLDSRTSQNSVAYDIAREMMIPTFENSMFLDNQTLNETRYKDKLTRLSKQFEKHDKQMVITHCNTKKQLEYLKRFVDDAKKAGYTLIPASGLFSKNLPDIL